MKIPSYHYPSPLGRWQPSVTDLNSLKQRGWRDQNILVVNADDTRLDPRERELVQRIGERLYGRGGGRHG